MNKDDIAEIRIDATGRLCVSPQSSSFSYIFRAGMEVYWDNKGKYLHSPPPREWSYLRWFQQIVAAVKAEYGCTLVITPATRWKNIDDSLKMTIISGAGEKNQEGKGAV